MGTMLRKKLQSRAHSCYIPGQPTRGPAASARHSSLRFKGAASPECTCSSFQILFFSMLPSAPLLGDCHAGSDRSGIETTATWSIVRFDRVSG
jgi:hypothetical protein